MKWYLSKLKTYLSIGPFYYWLSIGHCPSFHSPAAFSNQSPFGISGSSPTLFPLL